MEVFILIVIVFIVYSYFDNDQNTSSNHQKIDTSANYFTFDAAILEAETDISGQSIIIKDSTRQYGYVYFMDGPHSVYDANFTVLFSVQTYKNANNKKFKYLKDIVINNKIINEKVTNIESAASVSAKLYNETNGALFQNSAVGQSFIELCSDLIIFNKLNEDRTLINYKSFSDTIIDEFIVNTNNEGQVYVDQINNKAYDTINENESKTNYHSSNFDIYLKILEFKSMHNIGMNDIKAQYRKLAKLYHPDSSTGDATRFKLINEAYEYLLENYTT